MTEYIARSTIKYEIWPCGPLNEPLMVVRKKTIDAIPAADAAEVVGCKNCKHWKHFDHLGCTDFAKVCGLANYMTGANGFCLYGERKGGDADGQARDGGSIG